MKKEIEAFVNAANEQELEAAWNNLSAEEQRVFEQDVYKRQGILPGHPCLLEQRGRPAVTCRGGGPSILLTQDRSVA